MISLVIPVYNEGILIQALFERSTKAMEGISPDFEIICVDDGSTDCSLQLLVNCHYKDRRFKVVSLSRNFGHQSAVLAGLSYAEGDYIAVMDGDLQDPPEILRDFYLRVREGFDVVYGVRRKRKESAFKRVAYWLYYRILGSVSNTHIPLDSGDFSMVTRRVLDLMLRMPEQSLFLRGTRSWVGFRQTGVEYERNERAAGVPKYNLKKLFILAYNGLFSFSTFPVKILAKLGLFVFLFSIAYSLFLLAKKIFFGGVPAGFTTLILVMFLLNSVQLIALGLIGEYVLRIYDEARQRPLFIVKETHL